MNQVLPRRQEAPLLHRDIAGDLYHPLFVGMRCHTGNMNLPTTQMYKEQDVIRHKPAQCPDFGREEVGRHEDVHVRTDKLLPRGRGLALGGAGMPWRFRMLPTVWSLIV